jgi:hypothetical protein
MLTKKNLKFSVLAGAALAAGLFIAAPAQAKLVLTFSETGDPGSPHTVDGTTSGGINSVSFSQPLVLPDFTVTIENGDSNEPSTSGQQAFLESQVLRITDSATTNVPVSLTVTLTDSADPGNPSDIGFTIPGLPGSTLQLASSLGGAITKQTNTGTDTISFQSFANGTVTGGPQSSSFTSAVVNSGFNVPNAPIVDFTRGLGYSLSNTINVTLSNSGDAFNLSGTTTTTVPEPATAALGLIGACGLLLRRRNRNV